MQQRMSDADVDTIRRLAESRFAQVMLYYTGMMPNPNHAGDFRSTCPIHHGTDLNFEWSARRGSWMCYSHCGRGTVFDFVMQAKGWTFRQALHDLAQWLGYTPAESAQELPPQPAVLNPDPLKLLKESELARCQGDHPLWERVAPWVKEYLEGGYCRERAHVLHGRITFPVRDDEGRLVGIIGRCASEKPPVDARTWTREHWMEKKVDPETGAVKWSSTKYFNFGANKLNRHGQPCGGFKTGSVLMHMDRARLYADMPLLLVEGPFDLAKAIEHGYRATVAVQGSMLSKIHWTLIAKYFRHVIYALDPDTFTVDPRWGHSKFDRFLRQAHERTLDVSVLRLPDGVDIGDSSPELFRESLWRALTGAYCRVGETYVFR